MNIRPQRSLPLIVVLAAFVAIAACSKKEKTDAADKAVPVDAEAPAVVVAMIDAHGGMPGWRVAKTLSFESDFHMADDSIITPSFVTLDLAKKRAYVEFGPNGESMAWDGKRAYSMNWAQPYPPGLRAVLDAYMVQLPWLAMDPGVKLSVAGKDTLWTGPTQYTIVKMSLRSAPGGPYRLYIDPETKRLHACAFHAAEGEEIVVFGDPVKAEGMMLPTQYEIYNASHAPLAAVTLEKWSSGRPFDENKMTLPDSAAVAQPAP
jgi:hypothetical protein